MADITYFFRAIPDEFLSDDFLEDVVMMKLIRYMMKKIKYAPHVLKFPNNRTSISLELQPFEFVFGRDSAIKECGCSEKKIRTRIDRLRASSYLQEILIYKISSGHFSTVRASSSSSILAGSLVPKRASTFTVYKLMPEAFCNNKGQQFSAKKGQQFDDDLGQHLGHKQYIQDVKKQKSCLKETSKEKAASPDVVSLFSSHNAKKKEEASNEVVEAIESYIVDTDQQVSRPTIRRWVSSYGAERVLRNISYVINKNKFRDFGASVTDACQKDYAKREENILINREFAEKFYSGKVKIFKNYCVDKYKNDYQFHIEPEEFKKALNNKFNFN